MRLASLAEVVRGRLLNSPSVSFVNRFVFEAGRVRQGDCFIALDEDANALQAALKNGAYAVIFAGEAALRDTEIGWIRVKSFDRALLGLLRFLLVQKEPPVFYTDAVGVALAKAYIRDGAFFASDNLKTAIERLQQPGPAPAFLLDRASALMEAAPEAAPLNQAPLPLLRERLFETWLQGENGPVKLPVSSLFAPQLSQVAALARDRRLALVWHTHPVALPRFEPIAMPRGDRLLIFDRAESDEAEAALAFLKQMAPWAKIWVPGQSDPKALADALIAQPFQYAYLNKQDKNAVLEALEAARPQTPSLF